ncbi:hypothetical protein BaRGS_00011656 [Batillaria attramentaria]|uniref:Uncharacterized protein n=1 Tax=Batillaria attramentaria TaxID=370345 RepID=A0ABD0LCC2_9CAEN
MYARILCLADSSDFETVRPFPTAAVAGGVGAVVVVIIVVVIVVLVIISRRKKRAAEGNQMINDREEGNEPERQTYDRLQPASLADNRDYTELTVSTVSSGLQTQDARQTYERLQPELAADNRNYTALSVSGVTRGQRSQGTRSDRHGNNTDVPQDEPATDGVYETTELS